jgi:mRNA interferase YafQ
MTIEKIKTTNNFEKSFKKFIKKNLILLKEFNIFFDEFIKDPINFKFGTHKLKGKLQGFYSTKIKYDLRLIFEYSEKTIILIDIGVHSKVY